MSKTNPVEDIANLACLKIEESEVSAYQENFEKILHYFENLEQLDTSGVEPMVTPHAEPSELRKDEVIRDLSVEEVLENAPEVKDSLFKVPPVV